MKRSWLLLACVLPSMCLAQTTVKYDLSGHYIVQASVVRDASWFASSQCIDSKGNVVKENGGGSMHYTQTYYGTIHFSGGVSGTADITLKTLSVFDQTKSDATVVITWIGDCVPTVDNGYAVFDPPVGNSESGTYSINSTDGTGTITISGAEWAQFQTTGSFASCASGGAIYVIPNTMLIQTLVQTTPPTPNLYGPSGIAEHINETVLACP